MTVKIKHLLNASPMSTKDYLRKMFDMTKFGMTDAFGGESALKMWEVRQTGLGDPRFNISCHLNLSSRAIRNS